MADDESAVDGGRALRTQQDVLDGLNRLRIQAARKRGKVRLSLQDLETMSGVPKSSLANYLAGRTLMPMDVLDRVVIALGVTPSETLVWAEAWERVTAYRLDSRARQKASSDDDPSVASVAEAGGRWRRLSPYRGTQPFDEQHEELLHGRERLTAELVRLADERLGALELLMVTGPSGVGKSSLVRAGLLPAIARGQLSVTGASDWPRLVITPTSAPLDELASQLARLAGVDVPAARQDLARRPSQARQLARQTALAHRAALPADRRERCGTGMRLVLVVDQFEELFTLTGADTDGQEQRSAYLAALLSIAMTASGPGGGGAGLVILTVRNDHLDRCAAFPGLVPILRSARIAVDPIPTAELSRVITGPATAAELTIEHNLVEEILAEFRLTDGRSEMGMLPLLSQILLMLWEQREGGELTRRGYRRTGGAGRLVATLAEDVYETLTESERRMVPRLFLELATVTADGLPNRRRITDVELAARLPAVTRGDGADWRAVLNAFVAKRLVVLDQSTVEIAHDLLLRTWPRLRGWLGDALGGPRPRQLPGPHGPGAALAGWDAGGACRGAQRLTVRQAIVVWPPVPALRRNPSPTEIAAVPAARRRPARGTQLRIAITAGIMILAVLAVLGVILAGVAGTG